MSPAPAGTDGSTGTADILSAAALPEEPHAGGTPAVPVKPRSLVLPIILRNQLIAEAQATFPRECCGLIEGVRRGETVAAVKLHPTRNLAPEADRFEIDPMEQFRLLKTLRGTERDIVGCYHSHPNGVAEPSRRDLASAGEEGFVWLIVAEDSKGPTRIAAYVCEGADFGALEILPV